MQSNDQMMPFSGTFVAILVTSVVLILPAEVQTAVNKKSEEEGQKMEVGLRSIQQNFAYIGRHLHCRKQSLQTHPKRAVPVDTLCPIG